VFSTIYYRGFRLQWLFTHKDLRWK